MKNIAVILAGCGHLDGAEIRESIFSLLYIDKHGAQAHIFAPDRTQHHTVNHLTGKEEGAPRNILAEAARIARGNVKPLSELNPKDYDALVLPGGFGCAKNFSDLPFAAPENVKVQDDYKKTISDFFAAKKPIGAICIAPAVLTAALKDKTKAKVTVGEASNSEMISKLGGVHEARETSDICIDEGNKLITTSAYMRDDKISKVAEGIEKLIIEVVKRS